MTRILAIFIAVFCFACPSTATILINCNLDSAPSAETNGGTYTGSVSTISLVVSGTGGDYFDHVTGAACWGGGGGCGKMNLSIGQGGGIYRGYTPGSYSGGTTQLNYRYLAKWNSSWNGASNLKGNYMSMGGSPFWTQEKGNAAAFGSGFQMAYSYQGTLYRIHGNGQSSASCDSAGYECCPHEVDCSLGDGVAAAGPFYFGDYNDEWVCFEIELHSDGTKKIYIWTQDEAYNGLYMQQSAGVSGTPAVSGFGGAYFYDSGAADGAVLYIDEVIFADSYIGPPAGFISGGEDTTAPSVSFTTSDPQNIESDSLAISGTASDAVGVSSCKWMIGAAPDASNGTALSGTTSWSGTVTGFSEGANTLYAGCGDAAGNWGSDSITVNYSIISARTATGVTFSGAALH